MEPPDKRPAAAKRPATRFIQPQVLTRLANLELLARAVVEGFVAGLHKSPYKGVSVDFMEYRPYLPGDDPRHVDWKLYARSDRYYIKEYEAETNTTLHLLVDVSQSMGYASSGESLTKLTYSCYLAAALAYLMIQQRDAVGLTLFDDDLAGRLPPRSSKAHLHALLTFLEQAELGAQTAIGAPLHRLAEQQNERGVVVLISDLLDDPDAIADGLRHFRHGGNEVIVFHVMDPQEVAFELGDTVELEDMETGEKMLVDPQVGPLYQERLAAYRAALEKACGALGADYTLLTTDQPLDFALMKYLVARR